MAIATIDSSSPSVEETQLEDTELFILRGEFDAFTSPALETQLVDAIERRQYYDVIVDMNAVTFVDLSTLNVLARAMKLVYRRNGHLVVVCTGRPVLRAVDLAGMRHSLKVFPTREDALAALRAATRPT